MSPQTQVHRYGRSIEEYGKLHVEIAERDKALKKLEIKATKEWEESKQREQLLREALAKLNIELAKRQLSNDDDARKLHAVHLEALDRLRLDVRPWEELNKVIGSADGKTFRVFAQGLTLQILLELANEHLRDLAPRYRLMKVPSKDLEIQVIDLDMGEEIRGTQSLSGGETFLVSLGLALALSSFAAKNTRIRSLFIDEGFGSLDAKTLEVVLDALDALQASGRQVGIISHVPGLGERLGVQVAVSPSGSGRSTLRIRTSLGDELLSVVSEVSQTERLMTADA